MKKVCLFFVVLITFSVLKAQEPEALIKQVREKIARVNDYIASGKMKTNVIFMKVPLANVKVFFKNPNRLKIKNESGISLIPKGSISISLNNVLTANGYTALDAGNAKIGETDVKVIRLLPNDDNSEIVLSTLYIDPARLLVLKSKTTTKENGTYELEMSYNKFADYALPDKVVFSFNTKDYKLPKGITFDYDDGSETKKDDGKPKKGKVELTYSSYIINKGVDDAVFR
ncbi:MAG: LolA family protein [Sphingobacteriales bacterium]